MTNYLFCSNRPWSISAFMEMRRDLPGNWNLCISPSDLAESAARLNPRYIFFPHWSSIVPQALLDKHECVCFHMTDVPYGRGGSPLQNLIAHGHKETMLTALKMTATLDAGPVYFKRPLCLAGSAETIFRRASELSVRMMAQIVANEPTPVPQQGEPTVFPRRKREQSELPYGATAEQLYDHIRMLDAPGYPHAFLRFGNFHATFTKARIRGPIVEASVRFEAVDSGEST
ncbi:hypothetical protein [Sulfitobacter sp. 1A12779]|uniref:hypothetical protein n=1 Tax=Sulfitobacter sp. 1A12779 TaxID=3368599 RepID=UPI003745E387